MTDVLLALAALAAGLAVGWILAQRAARAVSERMQRELDAARAESAAAGSRAAAAEARAAEKDNAIALQRQTAEQLKKELETSFQALAKTALEGNTKQLLTVAETKFAPFDEQLKQLRKATEELEHRRQHAYGSLSKELDALKTSTTELRSQSEKLTTALRGSSQARGHWGESTLRRLAELAGMEEHCDFDLQHVTASGQRPDLVVRLPGKGAIPVDAKVPLAAYLDAEAAPDEELRRARLVQHAADLKSHVRELARRDYARELGGQVDFTVLFVPGEPLLSAALRADPELFDWALAQRILIASPVTLLALLRTVRMNWDKLSVEENAREIQKAASELYDRFLKFSDHLAGAGRDLERAVKGYNDAVGSLQSRVLPAGRRLNELRIGDGTKLPELNPIERPVRDLPLRESEGA
jgi:DNA recombination protein RmuC